MSKRKRCFSLKSIFNRLLLSLFLLLSTGAIAFAQSVVSGKVRSGDSTLAGVSISVKGTTTATLTDDNGNYRITAPSNGVLVFSYTGYALREVPVNGRSSVDVELTISANSLGEVIVVAYGNTTRKTNTGAIQTVGGRELQDMPAAQLTQKLQGKLAGVQINQISGRLGAGMQVRIRGSASISTGSGPLFVVDGFPIAGDISNINPDEIETITVLKDAASTAIYGSRAAFGVILVTTKSAKLGQTNISLNAYQGVQKVPQKGRPDMMNGQEWAQFKKEYYEDLGQAVPAPLQNPSQYGEGYDWYDAMLRPASIGDYNIALSVNREKFTSSIVAGYFRQEGVLLNSEYRRFTARANSLFKIRDNLRIGLNIAPTYTINNSPATEGIFFGSGGLINNATLTPPVLNFKNPDGSYPVSVTTPGITAFPTPNWVRSIKDIYNNNKANLLLSNAYIEFEPVKHLVLKSSINIDLGQSLSTSFQPSTASRAFASSPSALSANYFNQNFQYSNWLTENTIGYTKTIKEHTFDVLAGYTAQKFRSDQIQISGSNYPDDRIVTIGGALVKNNPSNDIQEWSLLSYLSRLNYNYKERYLLGVSFRRDGSSRFGANNKWGNFYSVSAGWVVSDEEFTKSLNWLSFLKLRGSYGSTGNNNIGNYAHYAIVGNANTVFGSTTSSGAAVTSLSNADLGWEETKQLDLGIDLSILNNRINIVYDFYRKQSSNILLGFSVPRESGFSSLTANIGKVRFWGHEIAINSSNLVGEFKWNTGFNIAFSDNKVLALSGLSDTIFTGNGTAHTITAVGGRIGQFWGLIQEGVYKNQADFDASPKNINSRVGTIKFRDLNKDGQILFGDAQGDRTVIGNPYPKFIFGITNNFYYKDFDLTIVATGTYGNDIARMMDEGTTNLDGVFNLLKEVKDRWRSEANPGTGKYGTTKYNTADDRAQFHTRFVQDGSFLTIKNITLGYNVPVRRIPALKSVRAFVSVQQAFVFTRYGGANPEVSGDFNGSAPNSLLQGLDNSAYPVPRTVTFGLNVNLK